MPSIKSNLHLILITIFFLVVACGQTQAASLSTIAADEPQQQNFLRGRQMKQEQLSEKVKYIQDQIESYLEGKVDADEVILNTLEQSAQHYQQELDYESMKLEREQRLFQEKQEQQQQQHR